MTTWLNTLQEELSQLDVEKLLEPNAEVDSDDHVIGVADDDQKRLYGLSLRWEKEAAEAIVAARFSTNEEQREHRAEQAMKLQAKSQLAKDIFWLTLREVYGLWQKPSVGIRKGWKVVWSEPQVPPFLEVFGDLLRRS